MSNTVNLGSGTATSVTGQTTGNPQTGGSISASGSTSSLQTTDASSALTSTNGIPLSSQQLLPAIGIGTAQTTQVATAVPATKHHINPVLLTVSIIFFLLAIALFVTTTKSAKKTTI